MIDSRYLASDPNSYRGRNLKLYGNALNVVQRDTGTWMQLMAESGKPNVTQSVSIVVSPRQPTLIRDECYVIWGIAQGTEPLTRTLTGVTEDVPLLAAYAIAPAYQNTSGQCELPEAHASQQATLESQQRALGTESAITMTAIEDSHQKLVSRDATVQTSTRMTTTAIATVIFERTTALDTSIAQIRQKAASTDTALQSDEVSRRATLEALIRERTTKP